MSQFKENNFFKAIFSFFKSKEQKIEEVKLNNDEFNKSILVEKAKVKRREWKKEYNPLRNIILWGYDRDNNPGFLILYGEQQYKSNGQSNTNILEEDVKYTSYVVFKGKKGHLPAFQTVRIIEESGYYNRKKNDNEPKMYYKTGLKNYWRKDENYRVREFVNLKPEEQIILPYFTTNSYEQYLNIIEEKNISFADFEFVKHPNEILKLEGDTNKYYATIYDMVCNENLYMRKKALNELLEMNPSQNIFEQLIKIGSTELISGLFLELAKRKNPILIEDAKSIFEEQIDWGEVSYIKGVKRCAYIYMAALNDELKTERIKSIYDSLPYIDLHLIRFNDKDIPEDKIIEGSAYRKYSNQGLLKEYQGRYDYTQRKWIEYRCSQRYRISTYSDGVILKILELKNTIQEAEAYGLAHVIGKIAYYLDAPRLNYYFRGNEKTKELKYFKRYIRRIIDSYGKNDSERFMQAMKALLTSYTEYDYICKFRGNFQFNELLKYYLYYDFKDKPPVGWENWSARSRWMEKDQLMELQGRYEYLKEIWDNHLDDVLDIASKAKINSVLKACYYIIKESNKTSEFIDKMQYSKLISLTEGSYEPLANMFMNSLIYKVNSINTFNPQIMFALMSSKKEENHILAIEFMNKNDGEFSADNIVDLLQLDNLVIWENLFRESLLALDENNYCNFVKSIINNSNKFINTNGNFSKDVKDVLLLSTNKTENISEAKKADLLSSMIYEIYNSAKMPEWIQDFVEEVIFSISYEELENLLNKITIEPIDKPISQKSRQVISILETIKNKKLPSDSEIISILETGSSKMIKILFSNFIENNLELSTRFSTLLIMLESDITILNEKAEEIFDSLSEEKRRKLHGIVIDSPVNKVYSFGLKKLDEIYKDSIPKELIIKMLEHTSSEVKAYISNKADKILSNLSNGNKELFMYYVKTLLLLPNKISKSKEDIYKVIPKFVAEHKDKLIEFEDILLDIGGSNITLDSERALTTLAKIRKEVVLVEG